MQDNLKRMGNSILRLHGYTLNSDASNCIAALLEDVSSTEREHWLELLVEALQQQPLENAILSRPIIEQAAESCTQGFHQSDKILSVIDAFRIPRFVYHKERRKLVHYKGPPLSLFGTAASKVEFFQDRYTLLHQRTSRHELFLPPIPGAPPSEEMKRFELKPVEFLLATTARLGGVLVLGMLCQLKEGKFFLEDPTGAVELDLKSTKFHTGLITENCFVLAEGTYDDGIFHVNAIGLPPAEPAQTTRAYFGNANFFGGPSLTSVKVSAQLQAAEKENSDAMFVFISDVWLNEIKVMKKLHSLFSGFSQSPPTCFIFIGNFLSMSCAGQQTKQMKDCLKNLADIIAEFPSIIQNTHFIFVPGPRDPGLGTILPRPCISSYITEDFRKKVPNAVFTTNPCRIQYCTQEIVVFREDIVTKMCRNTIYFPTVGDIPTHFVKTLISQSHLCPLPLHVSPIYWCYDHVLRLYPLPDVIVCADRYDSFCVTNMECTMFNPGSFPRNNFHFNVYMPASKHVEDSQIPSTED